LNSDPISERGCGFVFGVKYFLVGKIMKPYRLLGLTIGIGLFLVLGCENRNGDKSMMEAMKKDISDLQAMQKDISDLDSRVAMLEISKDPYNTAFLDPSEKGYQRLDSNCGIFLVSVQEVKPYLDGCKITFHIGNPSSVLYPGFRLKLRWGKRHEKGEKFSDWVNQLQEKEQKFTEELKPGWWNKVVVTVSPAKPDQLGYLELSMKTDMVKLLQSK
jgi:hypothetical protein